jgi:sulfite exporter TauE/SafE
MKQTLTLHPNLKMTIEFLWPAALVAGFFGSTHCIGMCGAIVVLFEQQVPADSNLWLRRIVYNTGRLGFYVLLGIVAGTGGAVLTKTTGVNTGLMILRLLAGALVIAIGLNLLFNWSATRFLEQAGAVIWRRLSPLARHILPVSTLPRALAAGFLWGALPCGLVYSAVAMAATSGNAAGGAVTMAAFWAGTLPALALAGASAERVNRWKSNRRFRRVAGIVMIIIGLLALMPLTRMALSAFRDIS